MKTIQLPDYNRVILWKRIRNYLDNPADEHNRVKLLECLKLFLFSSPGGMKTDPEIEAAMLNESHLTQLISDVHSFLSSQIKIIPEYRKAINRLTEIKEKLATFISTQKDNNLTLASELLLAMATTALDQWQELNTEEQNWYDFTLFQIIEGYSQFLVDTSPVDRNFPVLNQFYDLYAVLTGKTVLPLYLEADEENIVIEPNIFPDSLLIDFLRAGNIHLDIPETGFVFNALGERFMRDELLISLYTHEFGHFVDRSWLNLSNITVSKLTTECPQILTSITPESFQWVSELVADAFAIAMSGPAYLFALLDYLRQEEILYPSIYHPGIVFRAKVMYNYLLQNELINLLTPETFAELQTILYVYNEKYNPPHTNYFRYEKVLESYLAYIYKNVLDFLQNINCYSSYEKMASLICQHNGNLYITKEALLKQNDTLQNILFLSNINWLIRLNEDRFTVFSQ